MAPPKKNEKKLIPFVVLMSPQMIKDIKEFNKKNPGSDRCKFIRACCTAGLHSPNVIKKYLE